MHDIYCPICGPDVSCRVRYPERVNRSSMKFVARKTPERNHFQIVQCSGCGLVYSTPIIEKNKIMDLYKNSDFISEYQLENMASDYLGEFKKISKLHKMEVVLEVGCSNGFFLQRLKNIGVKDVYGVEPGKAACNAAISEIRKTIINNELREGLFEKEFFDAVLFFQVFDHIVEPNEFLQLVYEYLKRGGVLLAIHHNIKSPLPTILRERASTYDLSHIYLWDKKTMRLILEKNGFNVMYITNLANSYQIDHIIRMLPLPDFIRSKFRLLSNKLRLSDKSIRLYVENMVCAAYK